MWLSEMEFLYSLGWYRTPDLSASVSLVLGFQVCIDLHHTNTSLSLLSLFSFLTDDFIPLEFNASVSLG